ncbi:MAG: uroporphyrinogen-III synthase [Leucobacter sp.]
MSEKLAGCHVLVSSGGTFGERIAASIRSHGGTPVLVALTEYRPPSDPAVLRDAVARWNAGAYDWLVVTSARGVDAITTAGALPGKGRIAAVGPATADELAQAGLLTGDAPDLQPHRDFTGAALAQALIAELRAKDNPVGARVLLPLSEIAEPTLERALRDAGHHPDRVTAYRTIQAPADPVADIALAAKFSAAKLGAVLVLSASGARALAHRFAPLDPRTVVAAIGEPTARELARLGISAHVVAATHTGEGVVDALAAHIGHHSERQSV